MFLRARLAHSICIAAALSAGVSFAGGPPRRGSIAAPAARAATPTASRVNLQTLELAPTLPKADGPRKAVKLNYMMSDDTIIWGGVTTTLDAYQKLGTLSPTAHSLVFLDEPNKGAALWLLGDNPGSGVSKSPLAPGVTNVPANSLLLMTKIFRWVFANYPGERRYLQIDSHGGGVFGIGTDSGENPYPRLAMPVLPIQGFARALRDGTGGKPIDVVFFNACMMANIEALYEISPSVRYAVGSELPIGGLDATIVTDMPLLFERMIRDGQPPEEIARALAKQAMKATSTGVTTAVAMNLGKLAPLVAQVGKLTKALIASFPRGAIAAAMKRARDPQQMGMGDLWTFARNILQNVRDPAVQAEARALFRLEAGATLFEKTRPLQTGTKPVARNWGGLSIYMPQTKEDFLKRGYPQTRFARETGWNKLLEMVILPR
jgi:hypothetical protein